ncbi:hypothetical protein [Kitasatospora sp. NPDC088346]|uniref:hypothetical protein n=1 Tax=Kitasatospora sp. NPDC088346 TaxID=3364073 RepID=UPI003820CBDE
MTPPPTVPPLDSLCGDWISRADLAHLPSLRNQWGQAHVNADLTSLSWLAIPPFSGGYHTGVLRIDGRVPEAAEFQWSAWGVRRRAGCGPVTVTTDTRMGYEGTDISWRTELTNTTTRPVRVTVSQELLAPIAHSETGWGWLYGTPWNDGHHHDFFTTERVRAEVLADRPRQVQFLAPGPRHIRLGSPRTPGIQRDEDGAPMLLDAELPDHTSPDAARPRPPAARAVIRDIEVSVPRESPTRVGTVEYRLDRAEAELRLEPVTLPDGATLAFDLLVDQAGETGVLLTHGNHPDSIQFGLDDGTLWLRAAGELLLAPSLLSPGTWHRVSAQVGGEGVRLVVDGVIAAATRPWWSGQRWRAERHGDTVLVVDAHSPARSAYAFGTTPDSLSTDGSGGVAIWNVTVSPGTSVVLGTVLHVGTNALDVLSGARSQARQFPALFETVARRWRETWAAAFTPGNTEFSGHLPTLTSHDAGLARSYYLGALLAIYMRNTGVSPLGPVFLTGGPRLGPTITFYWDQSEWARTASLLEPAGIRAWILAALAQPYHRSHSFDTRNLLPIGNHYTANDHALFRTVRAYLDITGDLGLLGATAAGCTVLDHLRAMAYRHRTQRADFGGGILSDFGRDPWELLECVPNYRDAVVSFNAGHVGMLRSLARLLRHIGRPDEADHADTEATELSAAVLGQYSRGGRWNIAHPEGDETIGHCLDFQLVAADMPEDLSDTQRIEMVDFVTRHLLDGDWMRALAPDDPVAPYSDRADHGAAGAFGAWPGATAYGLCRLGRPDLAQRFLSRVHASTSGGLWGQAMEAVGDGRYRVAERGVSNRDCNSGVAVTEAVIAGLFGLYAGHSDLAVPDEPITASAGELHNVNGRGFTSHRRHRDTGLQVPAQSVAAGPLGSAVWQ